MVDPNGAAACSRACIDVAPTVANQIAPHDIDAVPGSSLEEQAGQGFAAVAAIRIIVVADEKIVEREMGGQEAVYLFDVFAGGGSAADIGLIGDDDQEKSAIF